MPFYRRIVYLAGNVWDGERLTVVDDHISTSIVVEESCSFDDCDSGSCQPELLQHLLEVEASREHLERYSQELSRLIDQSQRATQEAVVSARAKGEFLAMMSHEIRTPLNGILGMTAVLLERELAGVDRDCVETIRNSGEALLAIVNDILDFSKIEAGRLQIESAEFRIRDAIASALRIVEPSANRKSLRLILHVDPTLPELVCGDLVRVRQILLNLLSNAIKFTPAGDVRLRAELKSRKLDGYEIYFCVEDQGIGIAEKQQPLIFESYSQADVSTTRRYGGTGLGLAISKKLAELMGGEIGFRSRVNEGSSFWFTAVVSKADGESNRMNEQTAQNREASETAKNFRLLLVEDNMVNQKVALLFLKKLGYTADLARNGVEAIAAVLSARYDLVLMDCLMPEMDGFEATRRIRSQGGYLARIPIVAMTANAFAEDRQACLAAGMDDYLSKPVREADLGQKLETWLSRASELVTV